MRVGFVGGGVTKSTSLPSLLRHSGIYSGSGCRLAFLHLALKAQQLHCGSKKDTDWPGYRWIDDPREAGLEVGGEMEAIFYWSTQSANVIAQRAIKAKNVGFILDADQAPAPQVSFSD